MFPRLRAAVGGVLLVSALVAAGAPAPVHAANVRGRLQPAIVGGSLATVSTYPSVAFVTGMFANGSGESCSGSVVAPDLVLTAGHCAEDILTGVPYSPDDLMVVTGRSTLTDVAAGQEIPVIRVLPDPAYDPPSETDDAALLQLGRQTTAPPIPLAVYPDLGALSSGTVGTIAGWGKTSESATSISTDLRETSETVQAQDDCTTAWGSTFDPYSQFCGQAPAADSGTCNGDSGAPFIVDDDGTPSELGLATYVAAGCDPGVPDVFNRADAIAGWAEKTIVALGNKGLPATATTTQRMSHAVAKVHSLIALDKAFSRTVRGNQTLRDRCTRVSRSGFLCTTAWSRGSAAYAGSVSVWYTIRHGRELVVDHTAINRVTVHPSADRAGHLKR